LLPAVATAAGSAGTQQIANVGIDTGSALTSVTGVAAWSNPDGCATSAFVVLQVSNPQYRDVLAAVLMASASGKTVNFWVNGCLSTPWGVAPIVQSITTF
jgi:hypothetical protein